MVDIISEINTVLMDNSSSVPGYLFAEIAKSAATAQECDKLLRFLMEKLGVPSSTPQTKLKTLKLLKYAVNNGHPTFRQRLQKLDHLIKSSTDTSGPPDPLHGNTIYVAINNEAKELLQNIFDNYENTSHLPKVSNTSYSGMGSTNKTGKLDGFGNTPVTVNKNVVAKFVDNLSSTMEQLIKKNDCNEIINNTLIMDKGSYQPVYVPNPTSLLTADVGKLKTHHTLVKKHIPGRPGGGWDDDCDDSRETVWKCGQASSLMSADSLEGCADDTFQDFLVEEQFVESVVKETELQPFLSWLELDDLCRQCSSLNCEKLIQLLNQRLTASQEDTVKLRILMLLEALIYRDVVQSEKAIAAFEDTLQQLQQTDSKELKVKSEKILLILKALQHA